MTNHSTIWRAFEVLLIAKAFRSNLKWSKFYRLCFESLKLKIGIWKKIIMQYSYQSGPRLKGAGKRAILPHWNFPHYYLFYYI